MLFTVFLSILALIKHTLTHSNSDKGNLLQYVNKMSKYEEYSTVASSQGWCWKVFIDWESMGSNQSETDALSNQNEHQP